MSSPYQAGRPPNRAPDEPPPFLAMHQHILRAQAQRDMAPMVMPGIPTFGNQQAFQKHSIHSILNQGYGRPMQPVYTAQTAPVQISDGSSDEDESSGTEEGPGMMFIQPKLEPMRNFDYVPQIPTMATIATVTGPPTLATLATPQMATLASSRAGYPSPTMATLADVPQMATLADYPSPPPRRMSNLRYASPSKHNNTDDYDKPKSDIKARQRALLSSFLEKTDRVFITEAQIKIGEEYIGKFKTLDFVTNNKAVVLHVPVSKVYRLKEDMEDGILPITPVKSSGHSQGHFGTQFGECPLRLRSMSRVHLIPFVKNQDGYYKNNGKEEKEEEEEECYEDDYEDDALNEFVMLGRFREKRKRKRPPGKELPPRKRMRGTLAARHFQGLLSERLRDSRLMDMTIKKTIRDKTPKKIIIDFAKVRKKIDLVSSNAKVVGDMIRILKSTMAFGKLQYHTCYFTDKTGSVILNATPLGQLRTLLDAHYTMPVIYMCHMGTEGLSSDDDDGEQGVDNSMDIEQKPVKDETSFKSVEVKSLEIEQEKSNDEKHEEKSDTKSISTGGTEGIEGIKKEEEKEKIPVDVKNDEEDSKKKEGNTKELKALQVSEPSFTPGHEVEKIDENGEVVFKKRLVPKDSKRVVVPPAKMNM